MNTVVFILCRCVSQIQVIFMKYCFYIYKRKCPAGAEQIALCSPGLIIILIMGLYTLGYI